jgi:hypothetical protein
MRVADTALAKLMADDDMMTREELEAATGWHWRTRLRREKQGLPTFTLGRTKLYPRLAVMAWLVAHVRAAPPDTAQRNITS